MAITTLRLISGRENAYVGDQTYCHYPVGLHRPTIYLGKMKKYLCSVLFLFGLPIFLSAQSLPVDTISKDRPSFLAFYPVIFYFPETRLGFGGAAIYNYYPGKLLSSRPSQLVLSATYTLNRQVLIFGSYRYFLRGNRTEIFGEVGYFDYFYFYYGIGNDTRFTDEETYSVRFPRLEMNALEQIIPNVRIGLSYKFDDYNIYEISAEGLLEARQPVGVEGGVVSTAGIIARYDTRDNINLPTQGTLATLRFQHNAGWLGSDFHFERLFFNIAQYFPFPSKQIIAFNAVTGAIWGAPPFQEYLFLGGDDLGRGIVEGRYRDRHLLMLQAEYRFPIIWRFRGGVFASSGRVGAAYSDLWQGDYHFNYGGGIRFLLDPNEGIQLRFDVGLGSDEPGFYLTFGEAF